MKLANIMLAIGGGRDNTIQKYGVTAGEIAVLRAIHGEDAVFDVDPTDDDALNDDGSLRKNRQELGRLKAVYGKASDGNGAPFVEGLYPGAAARVFEDFDEIDLPDDYFKATGRVKAVAPVRATPAPAPKLKTKAELVAYAKTKGIDIDEKASAKAIAEAIEVAEAPAPAEDEDDLDGIDDMPAPAGEGIFQ